MSKNALGPRVQLRNSRVAFYLFNVHTLGIAKCINFGLVTFTHLFNLKFILSVFTVLYKFSSKGLFYMQFSWDTFLIRKFYVIYYYLYLCLITVHAYFVYTFL